MIGKMPNLICIHIGLDLVTNERFGDFVSKTFEANCQQKKQKKMFEWVWEIYQQIFDNGELFFSNISKIYGINSKNKFGIFEKFAMIILDVNNIRSTAIRKSRVNCSDCHAGPYTYYLQKFLTNSRVKKSWFDRCL